jgi:hypothetical protein
MSFEPPHADANRALPILLCCCDKGPLSASQLQRLLGLQTRRSRSLLAEYVAVVTQQRDN